MMESEPSAKPVIFGRSSSHFTRVARIFAFEYRVDHSFIIVRDLMSEDLGDYGGNPALLMPTLRVGQTSWFGALNICRELARISRISLRVAWPEHYQQPLLANAQELTLQAMSTEVALIMARLAGDATSPHARKLERSLTNSMWWLEQHATRVLHALPVARDLSFLEVTLYCLATHLAFREVLPAESFDGLNSFCQHFAVRPSIAETPFRFD
jgi:hypothetical protein